MLKAISAKQRHFQAIWKKYVTHDIFKIGKFYNNSYIISSFLQGTMLLMLILRWIILKLM